MIIDDRQPLRRAGVAVTLLILLAIGVAGSLLPERGLLHLPSPVGQMVTAIVSVAVIMIVTVRPRWLLLLMAAAIAELVLTGRPPLMFVAIYLGSLRGRRLLTVCTAGLAIIAAGLTDLLRRTVLDQDGSPDPLGWLSSFGIYLLLPAVLGSWQGAHRRLVAGLDERAELAEREQQLRADRARAEERARIAEEMHDVVAHQVSLMVLYAGAVGSRLSAGSADRAEEHRHGSDPSDTAGLLDQVELIRTTGRNTLRQLREVLGVLRRSGTEDDGGDASEFDQSQPGLTELDDLVRSARAAGLELSVDRTDDPEVLPALIDQAAFRVVREAVTNVIKHAGPVATRIGLLRRSDAFEVSVGNGPPSPDHDRLPGSGTGLVSLRHRVELLGGSFDAGARPDGGFGLRATFPLSGQHPDPEELIS